jgi:hypothetical protein
MRPVVQPCPWQLACLVFLFLLAAIGLSTTIDSLEKSNTRRGVLLLCGIRRAKAVWEAAGMRYKLKLSVGFYQCTVSPAESDTMQLQLQLLLDGVRVFLE